MAAETGPGWPKLTVVARERGTRTEFPKFSCAVLRLDRILYSLFHPSARLDGRSLVPLCLRGARGYRLIERAPNEHPSRLGLVESCRVVR